MNIQYPTRNNLCPRKNSFKTSKIKSEVPVKLQISKFKIKTPALIDLCKSKGTRDYVER